MTFDPDVFDRHPSSVELLSFGSALLDELLASVPGASSTATGNGLLRLQNTTPAPVVWYGASGDSGVVAVDQLSTLRSLMHPTTAPKWDEQDIAQAHTAFAEACKRVAMRFDRVEREKREARRLAIRAAAREVLVEAALADAVRDERAGLFGDGASVGFTYSGVAALAERETVPFRSLLIVVLGGEAPDLSGDHPLLEDLRRLNDRSLQRWRSQAKERGVDLLRKWRSVSGTETVAGSAVFTSEIERWIDLPTQIVAYQRSQPSKPVAAGL